jgi:hypothetical protein
MIRVSDNAAVVNGSQTEVNDSGTDRMLFTRVYIGGQQRLLASSQFRNPLTKSSDSLQNSGTARSATMPADLDKRRIIR